MVLKNYLLWETELTVQFGCGMILSEGYGVSTNELTFVAELENFDNDTLTGSEIVLSSL